MADPILEALTFTLESDLNVSMETDSAENNVSGSRQCAGKNDVHAKCLLPSGVILGQSLCTPCPIQNCSYITEKPLYEYSVKTEDIDRDLSKKEGNANSDQRSNSPKGLFLKHLLEEHHFVIDQVEKIANLHQYILHWKERFKDNKLSDFCVAFWMDEPRKPGSVKVEQTNLTGADNESIVDKDKKTFFMISDVLPEDKELRTKLWNERLELVLEVNRKERDQTDFNRKCIFCKKISTGNRSSLFHHMAEDHSFHIGQPDNLVFVEELFDFIDHKLNMLICIYCEKLFKDKAVLREHMRKKQHKRINPTNPEYDRFYVVNYLEPGKTWKDLDEEDPEDDKIEEEWLEVKEEITSIVCLFCSHQSTNFDLILSHMNTEHGFDFSKVTADYDFYQKVKIVNFVRRCVYQNTCLYCEQRFLEKTSLLSHLPKHASADGKQVFPPMKIWDQPEYYFPTYENDQFLILLDRDNHSETTCADSSSMVTV